jgi:hydroxyacylglutathione hydrolase
VHWYPWGDEASQKAKNDKPFFLSIGYATCHWCHVMAHNGDILNIGNLDLKLIHTPGHSPGGMCVHLDRDLFTGDTLFVGAVGRTDLPGASLNQLLKYFETKIPPLPDHTIIWPGHDYGDTPTSTIAYEKKANHYVTDFILE